MANIPLLVLIGALVLGIFSGILPGLHPNSIGAILIDIFGNNEILPIVLILILGVHSALAFLPSIFLGIPEGQTQIALLPGQRMFREGRGVEAAVVCAISVLVATVVSIISIPFIFPHIPAIFEFVKPWIGHILVFASAVLLANERKLGRMGRAAIVFLLAGAVGGIALDMPMNEPLFALFVGFFTMPILLGGELRQKIPEKKVKQDYSLGYLPYVLLGVVLGAVADLLPGISTPAQIAVFTSVLFGMGSARNFLAHVAAIEASHNVFALASAAGVGIARVGMVAMANNISPINERNLPVLAGGFLLAIGIGAFLLVRMGKILGGKINQIDMDALSKALAVYLLLMIFLSDGILGVAVLAVATVVGFLPRIWGIGRTHVMGSLIIPSTLHAFGLCP
ncbi:MAG: tripartite tricarboxylate transporter permease [Candidatus Micrarchaeota archaeon]